MLDKYLYNKHVFSCNYLFLLQSFPVEENFSVI